MGFGSSFHFFQDCQHLDDADPDSTVLRAPEYVESPVGTRGRSPCKTCLRRRDQQADSPTASESDDQADRFVESPEGWHKNPDCDLHGAIDLITNSDTLDAIDVRLLDDGRYSVALNAGLGPDPNSFPEFTVEREYVQITVDYLARRATIKPERGAAE